MVQILHFLLSLTDFLANYVGSNTAQTVQYFIFKNKFDGLNLRSPKVFKICSKVSRVLFLDSNILKVFLKYLFKKFPEH